MAYSLFNPLPPIVRHKVFISYYHDGDQGYRNGFEKDFGTLFISKSVKPGDIDEDVSTEYIKRLIREDYISDASVIIVLVGPHTKHRKHVDWEISAGLNKKANGYSGLMGIALPALPLPNGTYIHDDLPARLADNCRSGYATMHAWDRITQTSKDITDAIQAAFDRRISHAEKIDNSRVQMERNTGPGRETGAWI